MEKRFIVIHCETLGDQFECDADRTIIPKLFTLDEVKNYALREVYRVGEESAWCDTKEEALEAFRMEYEEEREEWKEVDVNTFEEAVDFCGGISTRFSEAIETYEIMDDGTLEKRVDLTTYE